MPLSELLRLAESGEQKPCPRGDDGLVELVWENGQIMVQSQSNRSPPTARIGKLQSMFDDVPPVVPSEDLELTQDDDHGMVPWLRNDPPQHYTYGSFPDVSGVTANPKASSSRPSEALRSGVSDVKNVTDADQCREIINDSTSMKTERQNSKLLNFCHFARPASLVSTSHGMEINEKNRAACAGKPLDFMLRGRSKDVDVHASCSQLSVNNRRQPKDTCLPEITEKFLISTNTANSTNGVPEGRRNIEAVVTSSSVGSGNSTDRVSLEKTHSYKRKFCDIEESECHSDDIETVSVGVKKLKPARGVAGSKRSRAAEVHNLSERRRRDRINEKMRALQELIPNCNKVDKASMLDEAIEYLKTLQLQVQIMSMGGGSCMPPMMFQHMHPAHVPHFPAMGVGMGMGARYGTGMIDMNHRIPGYPIFPVPPMQMAHFAPMSGPSSFHRMPAPNVPAYGLPAQGLYSSVVGAPSVPLPGQPSAMETSGLKNGTPNTKSMCSMDKSNQMQGTNEALNQPSENKYCADARAHKCSTKETGCHN